MGLKSMHEQKNQVENAEIQKLLSEKQELVLIVAEQKKRIAEQTEQIERLNESDYALKRNKELEKKNRERELELEQREKILDERSKFKNEADVIADMLRQYNHPERFGNSIDDTFVAMLYKDIMDDICKLHHEMTGEKNDKENTIAARVNKAVEECTEKHKKIINQKEKIIEKYKKQSKEQDNKLTGLMIIIVILMGIILLLLFH